MPTSSFPILTFPDFVCTQNSNPQLSTLNPQLPYHLRRVSANEFARTSTFDHDRPGGTHCVLVKGDTWSDKSLSAHPAPIFDDDGFGDEIEGGLGVIMRPRAEKGPLGKTHVGAKGHFRQTEDQDFIRVWPPDDGDETRPSWRCRLSVVPTAAVRMTATQLRRDARVPFCSTSGGGRTPSSPIPPWSPQENRHGKGSILRRGAGGDTRGRVCSPPSFTSIFQS